MAENTSLYQTAEAWAEIVIKNWLVKMARLNIGKTGDLARSFAMTIQREANGNPVLIEFAFNYYGKFVDMGVGNGVKVGDADAHPKPWYSKEFFSQVKRFAEIFKEKYEQKAVVTMVENISKDG